MNAQASQSIPSFVSLRKTRDSVSVARFKLEWSFGSINIHVRHAINTYLSGQPGVIDVDFPGKNDLLDVKYDPALIRQKDIIRSLECPQIHLYEVTAY